MGDVQCTQRKRLCRQPLYNITKKNLSPFILTLISISGTYSFLFNVFAKMSVAKSERQNTFNSIRECVKNKIQLFMFSIRSGVDPPRAKKDKIQCFNIVTLDKILIFNFIPILNNLF